MQRRRFLTSAAALMAVLPATRLYANSQRKQSDQDLNAALTGLWVDAYLREPSAIIITCDRDGTEAVAFGTYWHDEHGQCSFGGHGRFAKGTLEIEYGHQRAPDLGSGTISMGLAKAGEVWILAGTAIRSDGAWAADAMSWYKRRR